MNKDLMRKAGFGKEVEKIEKGECPICGIPNAARTIRDDLSKREFQISGMCQKCQDVTFG